MHDSTDHFCIFVIIFNCPNCTVGQTGDVICTAKFAETVVTTGRYYCKRICEQRPYADMHSVYCMSKHAVINVSVAQRQSAALSRFLMALCRHWTQFWSLLPVIAQHLYPGQLL